MYGPPSDKEPLLTEIESLANNLVPYGKNIEVIKIRTSICNVQNVLLLFLTIIQTLTPLMVRKAHQIAKDNNESFLSSTTVFITELFKIIFSLIFLYYMHGSVRKLSNELKNAFMKNKNETFKVCLPALIYVIHNNLYYFALKHVDATLFSITYQLRILTTALLMVILLNKIFSGTQWAALFISLLGVILVQASSQTSVAKAQEANPEKSEQFLGLMTVLGMCWMTAFAGVYLERVLKKSSFDIWLQNIHLSTITLPFALLTIAYDSSVISQYGFFYGWSPLVWVVSITGAVGGLIIAAVMKYADNIKKCFSTSVALGGTSILSILMGDSVFSFLLMFGVSLVMLSVFLYTLNPPGNKQSDKIQPVETNNNSNTFLEDSPTEVKKTTNKNI